MSELCKWEQVSPIILLVVAEDVEELFYFLVDVFSFFIHLGVKGCGEGLFDS